MNELQITLENGKYYLDGKLYKDCNHYERNFFNNFFTFMKWKR